MKSATKYVCPLCKSENIELKDYKIRDNKNDLRILKCKKCSMVFLSSFEHINQDFYKNGLMHSYSFNPQNWLNNSKEDDLRRFNLLKNEAKNKKVLDFGCGAGGFLLLMKNVCSIKGVESQESLEDFYKSNNLDVFSSIDEIKEKFDVITMFHVLEHLKEPEKIIEKLLNLLNEKGEIIIEVPNEDDILLSLYKCKPFADFTHWSCHLFCYNKKTLKKFFSKMNVKINYIKPIQRYGLANHLYWLIKGQKGGHLRWKYLNNYDFIYKKIPPLLNKSDTLIISISK